MEMNLFTIDLWRDSKPAVINEASCSRVSLLVLRRDVMLQIVTEVIVRACFIVSVVLVII